MVGRMNPEQRVRNGQQEREHRSSGDHVPPERRGRVAIPIESDRRRARPVVVVEASLSEVRGEDKEAEAEQHRGRESCFLIPTRRASQGGPEPRQGTGLSGANDVAVSEEAQLGPVEQERDLMPLIRGLS
jgi:hypothetical protein